MWKRKSDRPSGKSYEEELKERMEEQFKEGKKKSNDKETKSFDEELKEVKEAMGALTNGEADAGPGMNEREILYKLLFEMKSDLTDLKSLVLKMIRSGDMQAVSNEDHDLVNRVFGSDSGGNLLPLGVIVARDSHSGACRHGSF